MPASWRSCYAATSASGVPRQARSANLKGWVAATQTLTKDVTRVMSRIKALYRSWAIPWWYDRLCRAASRRWLAKIPQPGVRLQPDSCIRNWIYCNRCARKRDATCCARVANMRP